ncbi:MAG: cytochrome P450 [Blastocatellia bacterium]
MKHHTNQTAFSPQGHWLLGHIGEFRRDALALLREAARSREKVLRYRLGPRAMHLVNDPEGVRRVLQENHQNYDKRTRSSSKIASVSGDSLLVSNGAFWLRQRRLMQPVFHHQRLAGFVRVMTEATTAMLDRARETAARGEPLEMASEMMHLTFTIVGRTLFSVDVGRDADEVESAMAVVLDHTYQRLERILDPPPSVPTPRNLRFRRALGEIDRIVYRIIAERRGVEANDVLSMLLGVRDEETGDGMTDEQLRDETITFLLAGHETTANALAWTWYLLSRHSEVERRLRDEVRDVLGDRAPGAEDLPRLQYVRQVIREAMRLYPPIWIIERRAIGPDEIHGVAIPAGSSVIVSPYALHRAPDLWTDPETFDPDRFAPGREPDRFAYIPFGAGPRLCIGNNFALMEAQVIVAMIARRYAVRLPAGQEVAARPGITLRPRDRMMMRLEPL